MWKYLDERTSVMDVPGGAVVRAENEVGIALVFVPGARAAEFKRGSEAEYYGSYNEFGDVL